MALFWKHMQHLCSDWPHRPSCLIKIMIWKLCKRCFFKEEKKGITIYINHCFNIEKPDLFNHRFLWNLNWIIDKLKYQWLSTTHLRFRMLVFLNSEITTCLKCLKRDKEKILEDRNTPETVPETKGSGAEERTVKCKRLFSGPYTSEKLFETCVWEEGGSSSNALDEDESLGSDVFLAFDDLQSLFQRL